MLLRLGAVMAAGALLLGCSPKSIQRRAAPEDSGEALVYLQPFPQEADRLRFVLQEAWAEREDGGVVPLSVSLTQLEVGTVGRQRLLLSGDIPPGAYRAILFRVGKATLRTEEGDAALLVPEAPARFEQPFVVTRDRPALLFLDFRYRESLQGGINLVPAFSPFVPTRPTAALLGYVTSPGARHLIVFDKKTWQVVGVVPTGRGPRAIALEPLSRRAYVAASGEDAVEVIDMAAGEVLQRISLNLGDSPREVHLAQDRRTLLVVNQGSNTVSFVDVAAAAEVARVNVGNGPSSLTVDRTGRKAFVFNTLASTVSVLDIPSRTVIGTIVTESRPILGQFNRQGDRLYVAQAGSPYLVVIDPVSQAVLKRVLVGAGVSALKSDPATDLLYLGRKGDPTVAVYDPFSLIQSDFLRTGEGASHLAIDGEENNLYVARPEGRSVSVLNLNKRRVIAEIDVGEEPSWVALMGER